jgi:hypothetical protein
MPISTAVSMPVAATMRFQFDHGAFTVLPTRLIRPSAGHKRNKNYQKNKRRESFHTVSLGLAIGNY